MPRLEVTVTLTPPATWAGTVAVSCESDTTGRKVTADTPPAPVGYPASPPPTNGGSYQYTYTDSQGYFTLANLPASTNDFGAFIYGYKTAPLDLMRAVVEARLQRANP